jgi:hypothetical protein
MQMMFDWQKRQETLKNEMEEEENRTKTQSNHMQIKFNTDKIDMESTKKGQIDDLNRRYEELQTKEAEQKDENTQMMKKEELSHLQCMEDLQNLFEKKLAYEN